MIGTKINDGKGTSSQAQVLKNGALVVQMADMLQSANDKRLLLNGFLTDDGTPTGSNDMTVDGSVNSVDFYIKPPSIDKDLYISSLVFTLGGNTATLAKFANISSLSNGCDLLYVNDTGERSIRESIKTNFEIGQMCGGGYQLNLFNNVSGNNDGFVMRYDFKEQNGYNTGLILTAATNQKLVLRVKDDLSGAATFDIYYSGFEIDRG
jgi:hypothetical protein